MNTKFKIFSAKRIFATMITLAVLIAAILAVTLTSSAASDITQGKSFSVNEAYALEKNITPNGSITFEAELYIPEAYRTGRAGSIISNYDGGLNKESWAFEIRNSHLFVFADNGTCYVEMTYNISQHMGTDAAPQYAKIAAVADTDTGDVSLYVNGEYKEKINYSGKAADMFNTAETLCIGADRRPGNESYFKGNIRSLAIFSGKRTADEIALDNARDFYDTSSSSLLVALDMSTKGDGYIRDLSANSNYAFDERRAPTFTAGNIYELKNNITPNGSITFEAEIYLPDAYHNQRSGAILSNYRDANYKEAWAFEILAGGKVRVFSYQHGDVTINYDVTTAMKTNSSPEFVKIAVTVDTETGSIVLYQNGKQVATATNSNAGRTVNMYNTTETLCIGGDRRGGNAQYFKGSIKNVSMFKGIRTAEQIAADHARNLPDASDADLLFSVDLNRAKDGFAEDISKNKNHLNLKNWKTDEGRAFSSSDEPLYTAKDITEAPLTYEALIYAPTGIDRTGVLFGNYPNANGSCINFEIYAGGKPSLYIYENGALRTNYKFNYDVRRNAWVHLAVTQETVYNESTKVNDTVFKCYVNGKLVDTYTHANYVYELNMEEIQLTGNISIGRDVRDVQVYKGRVKNVAIHNKPLSADEVKAAYYGGAEVNSDSFIAYYDMTEEGATSAYIADKSGNGYDMQQLFFEKNFETEDYDFSFAVVGDTQFMVYQDAVNGTNYTEYIYDFIKDNYASKNMKYVFGLGDIIDNGKVKDENGTEVSTADIEWAYAKNLIVSKLGANAIPYSLIGGNHDFMRPWDTGFNKNFKDEPTFTDNISGYYQGTDVYNYYMNFDVEGTPYMLLALEYGANDDVLAWANSVISQNRHRKVIITTHGYMNRDGTTLDGGDYAAPKPNGTDNEHYLKYNNGDEMWDECVKLHPNVIMVLSGHIDYNNIVMREDKGVYGNTVHQFLIDPQAMDKTYGYETGMVAMFYFRNGGKDVSVEYVSTYKTAQARKSNASAPEVLFNGRNQMSFTIEEAPKQADKGEINVWLIGGQSNAVGYGYGLSDADPRYTNGFDNILYYGYSETWHTGFDPVKLGLGRNSGTSGAEIGIAEALGNTGEMNAVIKYAHGATALYPTTVGDAAVNYGTWTSPSYISKYSINTEGNKIGLLYENFINTVESAIDELERMGYTPVIKGMWWMQGEEETYNGGAGVYKEMLDLLSSDVRRDLNAPAMPFVIGKIFTPSSAFADLATVRAEQEAYAAGDTYGAIVDPQGYFAFVQHDNWHFDAATQRYLGESFVKKACEINGDIIVKTDCDNVIFSGGGLFKATDTSTITVNIAPREGVEILGTELAIDGEEPTAVTLTGGAYALTLAGKSVTFNVKTNTADVTTKYGTIPAGFADAATYPLVVFKDGAFVGAYSTWKDASHGLQNAVSGEANLGSEAQLLLRRDYTNYNNGAPASICTATNILIDLGGFTFTNEYTGLDLVADYPAAPYTTTVKITNGTMLMGMIAFIDTQIFTATEAGEKRFEVTFDAITIGVSESAGTGGEFWGDLIHTAWTANASPCGVRTVMTFNDCTIDLSGYTRTDKNMTVFAVADGNNVLNVDVRINGGEFITANLSATKFYNGDKNDSLIMGCGSDGKLTILTAKGGNDPIADIFYTEDGKKLCFVPTDTAGKYELGESEIVTPYGIMPGTYGNADKYPFVVFHNGNFIGAYEYFGRDNATSALSYSKMAGAVILMRRDFVYNENQYNNLSQTHGLTIDLGGFTFTSTSRVMFSAQKKTSHDTSITVKNGNVILGSHALMKLSSWDPATGGWEAYPGGNGFNFTFEGIKIALANGASTTDVICYNAFATADPTQFLNITFNECTFDLSAVSHALTLFDFTDAHCSSTAVINGGKIITSGSEILFADIEGANAATSFKFAKKNDGTYTAFELPSGTEPAVSAANGGELVLTKISDNGTVATYRLTPKAVSEQNFVPRANITLGSELAFNIYVPANENLTELIVDGEVLDLTALGAENGYYRITVKYGAREAAREIPLIATLEADGKTMRGRFTFSIPKYVEKLLADVSISAEEKALAYDVISYVRAAYAYFKTDDAEAIAKMNAILGDGYDEKNQPAMNGSAEAPTLYVKAVSYDLTSAPSIRFTLADGASASDFKFYVDGKEIAAEAYSIGGENYVEIILYAYQTAKTLEYTVGGESDSFHIRCYYEWSKTQGSDTLVTLVERFVKYCESAQIYRASVVEN